MLILAQAWAAWAAWISNPFRYKYFKGPVFSGPFLLYCLFMSLLKPENPEPLPRENPFRALAKMAQESLGRLPGHLVVIFFIALTLAVLIALAMNFAGRREASKDSYLQSRLEPQSDKAVLTDAQLRGTWLYKKDERIAVLKIGNGLFEIITYLDSSAVSRSFLRGGYRTEGNVIVLQGRKDLGSPIDPRHYEYRFYPLDVNSVSLYAETDGRIMTWRTPASEVRRLDNPEEATQIIFGAQMPWVKIAREP